MKRSLHAFVLTYAMHHEAPSARELPQRGVIPPGFDEDRKILVRVLPQCEEVPEGFPGLRRVARERGAPRQTQVGNRIVEPPIRIEPGTTPTGALVFQDLLELGRGLRALMQT